MKGWIEVIDEESGCQVSVQISHIKGIERRDSGAATILYGTSCCRDLKNTYEEVLAKIQSQYREANSLLRS